MLRSLEALAGVTATFLQLGVRREGINGGFKVFVGEVGVPHDHNQG